MNRGHLTFPESGAPNQRLRAHAETFERLIAALPAGQPWPRGINPATRTHWRRALEGFVGAVEAAGLEVDALPRDFYQTSIVQKITTADFRNANKRETAVLVFLSWLVEQGQPVAELELPIRKRFKPMQAPAEAAAEAAARAANDAQATAAAAGHLEPSDDDGDDEEEDDEEPEDPKEGDEGDNDGDDSAQAAPAAAPPPAAAPEEQRRESTVAPKQNVLHGLKSGVSVQFTRLGPGSTQIHAGKFGFEEVRRLGTMEHFLATVVVPPLAAKLRRDGQETVTFTIALLDPQGEELTQLAQPPITVDVPSESVLQAPTSPAPAAAPGAAPAAAPPAQAAQPPAGFVSWSEAVAALDARAEGLSDAKRRDAIAAEKYDALMGEIRSSRDLMVAAANSAKLAAERSQVAQPPVPKPPEDLPRGAPEKEPFERRLAERALDIALEGLKPNGNGAHAGAAPGVAGPPPAHPRRDLEEEIEKIGRIAEAMRKLTGAGPSGGGERDRIEDKIASTLKELLGERKSPLQSAVAELKGVGELLGFDPFNRRAGEGSNAIATALTEVGKDLVKQLPEIFSFYYNTRLLGMGVVPPQLSGGDPHRQAAMQQTADATAKAKIPEGVREAIDELLKAEARPESDGDRETMVGMCLISLMESFNQAAGSDPGYHDASRKIGLLLRTKQDTQLANYVQQVFQTIGYGSAVDPLRLKRILAIYRRLEAAEEKAASQAAAEAREQLERQQNEEREARAAALAAAKDGPAMLQPAGLPSGPPQGLPSAAPAPALVAAPPPAAPAAPDEDQMEALGRAAEEAIAKADRAIAESMAEQQQTPPEPPQPVPALEAVQEAVPEAAAEPPPMNGVPPAPELQLEAAPAAA